MFLTLRAEFEAALADALAEAGYPTTDLGIERPPADRDAVLASSVAFRLASDPDTAPPAVATEIAAAFDPSTLSLIDRVTTAGPYVNAFPAERYFAETLAAAGDDTYGHRPPQDTSVVVEHTSANPTGPVHVGRARNPIIGDAIARLLATAGYDVDRHYYINDAGRQMAVFTWAYETLDESSLAADPERDKPDYDLVRYYRAGTTFLNEGPADAVADAEAEIQSIMQGLEAGDEATYDRVAAVVDPVLDGMRESLDRLPAQFDRFVRETQFIRDGSTDALADRLQSSEHAVYDNDAWQLDLEDWGIEKNLVFLRSDGTSLYTTRDIAHHEWKFDNYDRAVTILGEDHGLQAAQLRATLDLLGNDTDRLETVIHSNVTLPDDQTMSTRAGTAVDLDELLDRAVDLARDEVERRLDDRTRGDLTPAEVDQIAQQVGIGAVRFDIVAKQPTKAITFEWDRALDFEAQSAPYIQYAHARACGILERVDTSPDLSMSSSSFAAAADTKVLTATAERDLLALLARFPAVIEAAAAELKPHQVATYARNCADAFNTFYRECRVLDASGDRRRARLALVLAAQTTLANALDVLGIAAPEAM
ncbi:MAG: arginyl-tRNA synthetase [halophilic archaeon J07HX5]|nr:MAG: arginyl-tRNA synthetase [halophilic archaeon J07HX5]